MERIIYDADLHDLTVKGVKLEAGKILDDRLTALASILLSDGSVDEAPTVDGTAVVDQIVFVLVSE